MTAERLWSRVARIRPALIWTRGPGLIWTKTVIHVFQAPKGGVRQSTGTTPLAPLSQVTVSRASFSNLQDLLAFDDADELDALASLLDQGEEGYLGYVDSECVHRSWLAIGPTRVWEHWSQTRFIPEGHGYVYYCETSPAARGLGVFPQVLSRISAEHPDLTLTMAIDAANASSRRAAEKAGWTHVETVTYSIVAGRRTVERVPVEPHNPD